MWEQAIELAINNGIWAVLFVLLLVYQLKDSKLREKKYQETINSLNNSLTVVKDVKKDVVDIKDNVEEISIGVNSLNKKIKQVSKDVSDIGKTINFIPQSTNVNSELSSDNSETKLLKKQVNAN